MGERQRRRQPKNAEQAGEKEEVSRETAGGKVKDREMGGKAKAKAKAEGRGIKAESRDK
jgi:hypothetical protein